MKEICLAMIFVFALQNCLLAQDSLSESNYKTWFHLQNPHNAFIAQIEQLKDTSILVSLPKSKRYEDVPIVRIDKILYRKKGRRGRGVGIGTGIGFGVGFIVGLAVGEDPSDPSTQPGAYPIEAPTRIEAGFILGIPGGLVGGIVGGVIGSARTKIPINGSQTKYAQQKEKLRQLAKQR